MAVANRDHVVVELTSLIPSAEPGSATVPETGTGR